MLISYHLTPTNVTLLLPQVTLPSPLLTPVISPPSTNVIPPLLQVTLPLFPHITLPSPLQTYIITPSSHQHLPPTNVILPSHYHTFILSYLFPQSYPPSSYLSFQSSYPTFTHLLNLCYPPFYPLPLPLLHFSFPLSPL